MIDWGYIILAGLLVCGLGLVALLYSWLSGPREDGISNSRMGLFWRPPKAPEDEWAKWKDD